MKRSPLRRPLALGALSFAFALAACGRVPGQFTILDNEIPSSGTMGGCTVPVGGGMYAGEGTLDVSIVQPTFGAAYFFFPLIENNLPKASSGSTIDPNLIQLSGFQIDITPLDGANVPAAVQTVFSGAGALAHFQVPWSGSIASGGGEVSAIVPAFPVGLAEALQSTNVLGKQPSLTVDLQVAALGTTNSGSNMTSDPFHFPVQVCSGCLVANVAPCPYTTTPANLGNACNPAQDDFVDCCTSNGALICPPTVSAP